MDNDVLERLLIDRWAGELTPDVEELLQAHLDRNPASRDEEAEVVETLRLARQTLARQRVIPLPAARASSGVAKWAWGMAACFLCGLALGTFTIRGKKEQIHPIAFAPSPSLSVANGESLDFWAVRRFGPDPSPTPRKVERRVIWKSPVERPEIF